MFFGMECPWTSFNRRGKKVCLNNQPPETTAAELAARSLDSPALSSSEQVKGSCRRRRNTCGLYVYVIITFIIKLMTSDGFWSLM